MEDTDLSLALHCKGWKSLYLPHVICDNEIPETYRTFLKQQRRWTAGPVAILTSSWLYARLWNTTKLTRLQKLEVLWFFFRLLAPLFNFVFLVFVLPTRLIFLDNSFNIWLYIVASAVLILSIFSTTPRALVDFIPYCIFEIGFSAYRFKHVWTGLLHLRHSKTWLVTAKSGNSRASSTAVTPRTPRPPSAAGFATAEPPQDKVHVDIDSIDGGGPVAALVDSNDHDDNKALQQVTVSTLQGSASPEALHRVAVVYSELDRKQNLVINIDDHGSSSHSGSKGSNSHTQCSTVKPAGSSSNGTSQISPAEHEDSRSSGELDTKTHGSEHARWTNVNRDDQSREVIPVG